MRPGLLILILGLLWICLLPVEARAQYRFDQWTADDGLPQNSVYGIVQTRDGYLWLATLDGLARFDGVRFTVFNKSNSPGIINNRFVAIFEDSAGDLWAATEESGVVRFASGRFTSYGEESNIPRSVAWIAGDANGQAVFYVTGTGAFVFSNDRFISSTAEGIKRDASPPPGDLLPPEFNDDPFYTSYGDGEGNLWFGSLRGGLYRARKQVVNILSTDSGLTDNNIYPIFQSSDGTMWVGTTAGLFAQRGERFELAPATNGLAVTSIGEMPDGRIVFSNEGELYVQDGGRFVRYLDGVVPSLGAIFAIHGDPTGDLWIGGLDRLTRIQKGLVTAYTPADGLVADSIKAIINAQSGGLWIGGYGGLSRFQDGRFTTWTETDGLPARTVRTLYEDGDGTLWIGTYDGGLARFRDGKFVHYSTASGLFNEGVFQILERMTQDGSGSVRIAVSIASRKAN